MYDCRVGRHEPLRRSSASAVHGMRRVHVIVADAAVLHVQGLPAADAVRGQRVLLPPAAPSCVHSQLGHAAGTATLPFFNSPLLQTIL